MKINKKLNKNSMYPESKIKKHRVRKIKNSNTDMIFRKKSQNYSNLQVYDHDVNQLHTARQQIIFKKK